MSADAEDDDYLDDENADDTTQGEKASVTPRPRWHRAVNRTEKTGWLRV